MKPLTWHHVSLNIQPPVAKVARIKGPLATTVNSPQNARFKTSLLGTERSLSSLRTTQQRQTLPIKATVNITAIRMISTSISDVGRLLLMSAPSAMSAVSPSVLVLFCNVIGNEDVDNNADENVDDSDDDNDDKEEEVVSAIFRNVEEIRALLFP